MPDAPRTFFVITLKGDIGPLSRPELREQLKAGAVHAGDQVRNAWGRPLGTVAEVLGSPAPPQPPAETRPRPPSGHVPAHETRRRPVAGRSSAPLIIAVVAVLAVAVLILVGVASSGPPPPPPDPVMRPAPPRASPTPPSATAAPAAKQGQPAATSVLPDGWILQDIGGASSKPTAEHQAGSWLLRGAGRDFWSSADEGAFLQRRIPAGDFSAMVRLAAHDGKAGDPLQTKSGLMVRADDDPAAAHTGIVVMHDDSVWFQQRAARGLNCEGQSGPKLSLPVWLRLQRRGDVFTAAHSPDGRDWQVLGQPYRLPQLAGAARLGMIVASFERTRMVGARFDSFAFEPAGDAPVAATLPGGLAYLDLGDARPTGSARHTDGVFTIEGGGADIWNAHDECAFVHRQADGDLAISVRVVSMAETEQWDKAGVMLRRGVASSAAMLGMMVTHGGQLQFVRRVQNGAAAEADSGPVVKFPVWLRLVRRGGEFSAAWSADGQAWQEVGERRTLSELFGSLVVGLAVSSHNRSQTNRTVFDSFAVAAPP